MILMLPILDDVTKSWFGLATWLLIVSTCVVSIVALNSADEQQLYLVRNFTISLKDDLSFFEHIKRMFAALFIHADYFHLGFNMLFLFAFGLSLEKRLGIIRFLVLYFGSGALGWLFYEEATGAQRYALGASGAISGVIAAYLILFPSAKFLSAVVILWFVKFFYIRAWVYILLWIAVQILAARYDTSSNVAYSAHMGGIVFGLLFGLWSKVRGVSVRGSV